MSLDLTNHTNHSQQDGIHYNHTNHQLEQDQQQQHIKKQFSNINQLNEQLVYELESFLNTELNEDLKNALRQNLYDYESMVVRRNEEKDQMINQLKESLVELTEKRFRASVGRDSKEPSPMNNNSTNNNNSLNNTNIEFLLNEKESRILELNAQLNDMQNEINKFKKIINEQDNVILSHNNNIYELKNNNETVLKAKQESFRLMTDDLNKKQKLIDDQNQVIKNLKEKIELLEEEHANSRSELEKRLSEKESDLQIKIATFEANLYEGRQYFEEMLNEKDKSLKEKTNELNKLKHKLSKLDSTSLTENEDVSYNDSNDIDSSLIDIMSSTSLNQSSAVNTNLNKFDSESMKNIKSLYEHQIELLKVKIEMLEKTCSNYQQGIKEMNKSFGYQQQTDEMTSMQIFKDIMQQLQKTNVQLETEKIDLEVRVAKFREENENLKIEKENLNKKYLNSEQTAQRLTSERAEFEMSYKKQLENKQNELIQLSNDFFNLKVELDKFAIENQSLLQVKSDYETLVQANQQLTQHYEELYTQASDIVNGNQLLNEQVQASAAHIQSLEMQVNDLSLQVDHLQSCNSELNTQKINFEMKTADLEYKLNEAFTDLKDMNQLRSAKQTADRLAQQIKEMEVEMIEKNELIDQLNQAKEFLAENNSKLLTNNIKIQLFIESMGLDQSLIESNPHVKEYDDLREQFKQATAQLDEFKAMNEQLETSMFNLKQTQQAQLEKKEKDLFDLAAQLKENQDKLEELIQTNLSLNEAINKTIEKLDAQTQCEESKEEINSNSQGEVKDQLINELNSTYLDQLKQYEFNFVSLQNENDQLLAEMDELKQKLNDSKLAENNFKELKQKYDELVAKLNTVEQQNSKYKAKLKQLLGKQKANKTDLAETKEQEDKKTFETASIQTDLAHTDIESIIRKLDELVNKASYDKVSLDELDSSQDTLVNFGANIAARELHEHTLSQLKLLENDLKVCMFAHNAKVNGLKEKCDCLLEDKSRLELDLENKLSLIEAVNKLNHELNETLALYKNNESSSLISQYEANINELTKENSKLVADLDELKQNMATFQSNEANYSEIVTYEANINELKVENSKLVADLEELKQNMAAFQSNNANHNEIQTYEANINELKLENSKLITDLEEIRQKMAETQPVYDQANLINEIDELKQKLSDSTELKQKHNELVAKLNTVEQQNVKYKAKLKQLMGKQKAAEANSLLVMAEQRSTCSTPVNHSPTLHDAEKHFDTLSTQTELDNQSIGQALEENLNLKEKLSSLENQLKELYDKNLVLCEQISVLNNISMNAQSVDELKLNHENEIKELNRTYIEQIKQYEANFNSIQSENDQLLEQIDELKLKLNEAKANDEARAKNEELLNKISTLEQTNLKYKAKLKQLVGKQKGNEKTDTHLQTLEEQRSLTTTPTIHTEEKVECKLVSSADELESLRTEFKAEKERLENLIELKQTIIDRLNQEVDLMNDKIEAEKSNAKESEEKCLNEANKEIKDKQAQIDSLTQELSSLNAKLSVKVSELEENLSKISGLEQQNLKYKAKLKQLLGKQKETGAQKSDPHTISGLLTIEEQRSLNTTPISHSPIYQEKHFETGFSQTDLSQQDIDDVFSQYNQLMSSYSCFESKLNESSLELESLKLVNQNLESLKSDYETKLTDLRNSNFELNAKLDDLNRLSHVEKVESSLVRAAPSNQENEELNNVKTELNTLKERLETTQQQNLKYKAKLKQLMSSNKKTSKQLEDGGLLHFSSDVGMQTDLEDALDKNLVLTETQQIESLTNELTNLKQINQKYINELNELENKLNEAVNENNSLRNVCAEYEERLKNETERLESTIMSKQSMIDRLNEEINEINDRVQTEKSNYDLLTQTHLNSLSVKETLERELENTNSLIEEKQAVIENLNAELNGLNERINMQKSEFESKLNELEHNYKIQIVNKDENINQLRQINEHNNDELKTHAEHKYTELKELIDLKQKMNESLINESNELKSIIESQRLNYEKQLGELMSIIKEKESKIIELNKSTFNFVEDSLKKEESNQTDEVQTELLTNDVDVVKTNLNLTNKCTHLEAQLKYCHEKCENVVLKLNQLKKQNESLNTKIKSIKSMIYI